MLPDFSQREDALLSTVKKKGFKFTPSYMALHPYVRRPGPESDYFLQKPLEFHADTSELVQMLRKGHHNVQLDEEAWDRLVTWIDLNVPDHGTWGEHLPVPKDYHQRRKEFRKRNAGVTVDPEEIPELEIMAKPAEFIRPEPMAQVASSEPKPAEWAFSVEEAKRRQSAVGRPIGKKVEIGEGISLDLGLIPTGEFLMGDADGAPDEKPLTPTRVEKPFYLSRYEITNAQYRLFDPSHDSAYISMSNKDQQKRGHAINGDKQPVARISWEQAMDYCAWLSERTGLKFTLPTEAQWEWACRAGSATSFFYGDQNADFSKYANLSDAKMEKFARGDSPKWHLKDMRFNDGAMVTCNVGTYQSNAWGLYDMHGNVGEWTRSAYGPYSSESASALLEGSTEGRRVVRGGSWYDRPKRARSGFRLDYPSWQKVYNVGFRVMVEAE